MNVLDLFSGIGGFSLALERAGMRTVAFCEIDPYCRAVLAKHWPGVPCYGDIRELTADKLASDGIDVDVLCGGFPCQDISLAGKGAGLTGERSGLWTEYARLIRLIRPQYVIVENVSALLSRGLSTVLGDLAEIGYDAQWHCVPASHVGAPHRRDRIWIVAYPRGQQHQSSGAANQREITTKLSRPSSHPNGGDSREEARIERSFGNDAERFCDDVADPALELLDGRRNSGQTGRLKSSDSSTAMANTGGSGLAQRQGEEIGRGTVRYQGNAAPARSWWATEPDVGRVAHGIPSELDGGGNAEEEYAAQGSTQGDSQGNGMSVVWDSWETGTTSPGLFQAGDCGGAMSAVPYQSRPEGRDESREAAHKVRALRDEVHSDSQQETRTVQRRLQEGSWPHQRKEAMGEFWSVEPDVGRIAHGVPNRVNRLRCLGNAVVPQIPEIIGRAIMKGCI